MFDMVYSDTPLYLSYGTSPRLQEFKTEFMCFILFANRFLNMVLNGIKTLFANRFLNVVIVFYSVEKRFYSVENLVQKNWYFEALDALQFHFS